MSDKQQEMRSLESEFANAGIDTSNVKVIALMEKLCANIDAVDCGHNRMIENLLTQIDNFSDGFQKEIENHQETKDLLSEAETTFRQYVEKIISLQKENENLRDTCVDIAKKSDEVQDEFAEEIQGLRNRNAVIHKALSLINHLIEQPRKKRMPIKEYEALLANINDLALSVLPNQKAKRDKRKS